jgi:hypothetical protein
MKSLQSAERAVVKLHTATVAFSVVLGLAAAVLAVMALLSTTQTAALKVQKNLNQAEMKEIRESLPGKKIREAKKVDGSQVVVAFQSALQTTATNNACSVEFDSVGDAMPFISKFDNGNPAEDWKAVDIQLSMSGPLPAIFGVMAEIKRYDIPFEFGDLDLQPSGEGSASGDVTAKTTIRVLIGNEQGA